MDMPRHFDAICLLSSLQVAKSVGPDELLGALEEFAPKLSPVIQDIYNQSIREGYIPDLLKSSIISPLQKGTPPQSIESDLRGGGVNRFSDRRISQKKLFGFWIWQIFYTDLRILLTQRIADLSNILARIVDLACNLVRILDCDFIVEL
jgi:hypothetical protein